MMYYVSYVTWVKLKQKILTDIYIGFSRLILFRRVCRLLFHPVALVVNSRGKIG